MPAFDHLLLTRFSAVLTPGAPPAPEEWLRYRLAFFYDAALPSVAAQEDATFEWLVLFDDRCPDAFRHDVEDLAADGAFTPLWSHDTFRRDSFAGVAARTARSPHLITTRMDSDDAIARDFMGLRPAAVRRPGAAVRQLRHGAPGRPFRCRLPLGPGVESLPLPHRATHRGTSTHGLRAEARAGQVSGAAAPGLRRSDVAPGGPRLQPVEHRQRRQGRAVRGRPAVHAAPRLLAGPLGCPHDPRQGEAADVPPPALVRPPRGARHTRRGASHPASGHPHGAATGGHPQRPGSPVRHPTRLPPSPSVTTRRAAEGAAGAGRGGGDDWGTAVDARRVH